MDPTDHVFFSNRSACYLGRREADKALSDAEECVRLKPDWAKGYVRKGAALHGLGQLDDAAKAYEEGAWGAALLVAGRDSPRPTAR